MLWDNRGHLSKHLDILDMHKVFKTKIQFVYKISYVYET